MEARSIDILRKREGMERRTPELPRTKRTCLPCLSHRRAQARPSKLGGWRAPSTMANPTPKASHRKCRYRADYLPWRGGARHPPRSVTRSSLLKHAGGHAEIGLGPKLHTPAEILQRSAEVTLEGGLKAVLRVTGTFLNTAARLCKPANHRRVTSTSALPPSAWRERLGRGDRPFRLPSRGRGGRGR